GNVIDSENLKVHPRMKELYKFFKFNGKVVDISDVNQEHLDIFSREVLKMISKGKTGWEAMLPAGIADVIKENHLFGYDPKKLVAQQE
ncbi:MAG: TonB-dependent receptor, partial [Flavobacterium sp.]